MGPYNPHFMILWKRKEKPAPENEASIGKYIKVKQT